MCMRSYVAGMLGVAGALGGSTQLRKQSQSQRQIKKRVFERAGSLLRDEARQHAAQRRGAIAPARYALPGQQPTQLVRERVAIALQEVVGGAFPCRRCLKMREDLFEEL